MNSSLGERIVVLGEDVIRLLAGFPGRNSRATHVADQLFRAATSMGANYQEAQAAESRADFRHKLHVALKEARETWYWLRIARSATFGPPAQLETLIDESNQLVAMLTAACKKLNA